MSPETRQELRSVLSMYYSKIFYSPEITRDEILDILEADLQYMDGEDALANVEQLLGNTNGE